MNHSNASQPSRHCQRDGYSIQQSRSLSLLESVVVLIGGLFISIVAQIFLFPLFGVQMPISSNFALTAILATLGFAYKYCVRRLFNRLH
ncbi:MAG: hypothetical protein V4488_25995 [Pseudomonadota bacterium]